MQQFESKFVSLAVQEDEQASVAREQVSHTRRDGLSPICLVCLVWYPLQGVGCGGRLVASWLHVILIALSCWSDRRP